MFKEIIISIIIVILIVVLDFVTQNYTNETINHTSMMLADLKEIVRKEEDSNSKINEIISNWYNRKEKLAYFVEHDELEKVDTSLTNLKSYIEVSDFTMSISSIDEIKYILEHIKQKSSFSLINVF